MQLIFELLTIKNKEKGTLIYLIIKCSLAAMISFTILNIANIVGIKWLAILAVIDLMYFVCAKLCVWVFLLIRDVGTKGIKHTYKEIFKDQYDYVKIIDDLCEKH